MISSSEQKKKRPRAFLFLCKQGRGKNRAMRDVVPQGHLFRCAPLQDAVPYTRFNIPSRRAGPACPAAGYAFFGGTHGSRPTGAYPPKKTTRRPLNKGAPRVFRPCVAQTEEGYIRRLVRAGTAGVNYSFTTVTLFAIWVSPLSPIVPVMVLLLRVRVIVPVPLFLYLIAALSSAR